MTAPSVTNVFSSSTTAIASQVNTNFQDIVDALTDGTADITVGSVNSMTFTGSGSVVFGSGGTVVYSGGALGAPSSGSLANCTSLPISGISSLAAGISTFLAAPSSAQLAVAITDGTGTGANVFNSGCTLVAPLLGTPASGNLSNCTSLPIAGISSLAAGVATFLATPSSANLAAALTDETGTGANVFASAPTLIAPLLGTPTSGNLTNCSIPISGITSMAAGMATFFSTPSSANLAAALTDETGTGAAVFASAPVFVVPTLGVATATTYNKVTVTTPATSAVLTIANGKTLTVNNTVTLTGTDSSTLTFGAGGTLAYTDGLTRIRLHTANGYGSGSTKIRRFTTTVVNTGTGVTYLDDSTTGSTFTITVAGLYGITYTDNFNGSDQLGISLNSSELTTAILGITVADRLVACGTIGANDTQSVNWIGYLAANDVIRPHSGGAAATTSARANFSIFRLS